ncbi:DUF488 family protein, N3 subclade [Salegentibacter tibetensis]|nr:DUF488 family protein [Salegentibacter tibetensis]
MAAGDISKENAHSDYCLKYWAPSDDLRKEFHQDKISYKEFSENYKKDM